MKPTVITAACALALAVVGTGPAVAEPVSPEMATKLAGRTVFLDPGHQGPNHSEDLSRQVDNGRGGTKDCQTTGMTTVNGVAEHTINWNVAQLVKASLESLGARVVLSRQDDSGWGGCVDERARAANESGAAVAVSIHADSAPASERGFHLIVPQLPVPDPEVDRVQSGPGLAVSKAVRDAYVQAGFPAATYAGVREGLQSRADVAGPALTAVPNVFVEMGNGANPEDAAVLESGDGQLKHAIAITTGVVSYLLNAPVDPGSGSADLPAGAAPARTEPSDPLPAAPENAAPENAPTTPSPTTPGSTAPTATAPAPGGAPAPAPGATAPAPGTATTPGGATAPGAAPSPAPGAAPTPAPGAAPTPGTTATPAPGARTTPAPAGTGTPATPTSSAAPAVTGPAGKALELLMPLARALGMDREAVTAELINLAYTLAATLFPPTR
ncbi:N-acetylmuramoyl-L-alanine amidase [Nocardia farcinica]|uniref:N-acetylmuramoyl-L-alanine amidase n=1 Tax=Nocardia farcinica TaxID=37329 RepID=UPI001894DEAA|nr:N-acetylmuramoyl-L-alanine amidase [Nocardia farcinica]MBF6383286.1 N-acetylmuramoyl-L-alanine amidase [Nocardia farcinica]